MTVLAVGCTLGMAFCYVGKASYYDTGKVTANGEVFKKEELTCASLTYGFNTLLRVTNLENNKFVIVRVNDRGPYVKGRIIDLTSGAFQRISDLDTGVIDVRVELYRDTSIEKRMNRIEYLFDKLIDEVGKIKFGKRSESLQ